MTFAMSTEGDSVKSALSEANDKHATDNHTDSSQDSTDAKNAPVEKPTVNNIGGAEKEVEKPVKEDTTEGEEGESDQESEASEKKGDGDAKKSVEKPDEKKAENDTAAVDKEEKDGKSEEDEGEEEEEEEEVAKKEEKETKEKKDVKEPKEKEEKASTASDKDEEEDEEAEGEEEEEDASEEDTKPKKKGVPLLDQPLQTSGKRERKNVQRFEEDVPAKESSTKLDVEAGDGTPLGEIPRVEASITRFKTDDLKVLYKLLFKSTGKSSLFKKNIKKFSGFPFKKDSEDYKKRLESCSKLEIKYLKSICEMLDLQKSGGKGELVDRIMDFLLEPKDSGKPVGGGRPKRASAVRANNRGYSSHDDYSSDDKHSSRARRDKGKRPNLKDDSSSDEEFKPGDISDASDEKPRTVNKRKRGRAKKGSSEEDEASLSAASSDESDDVPKSKRRKSITKATPKAKPKTPARGRGRPSRGTPAAAATTTPRKSGRERKPVRKHESSDEDEKADDGSSSEDEPLVKKKAKTRVPPTDDEIKTYIKSILEGANLEEITMKTVCQRVYDNYPDFDLTARKNFIKSTVKSLIST